MNIKLFCPAKINLFLEVLDKREDNYHNLDTVMMSVNLCDTVDVTLEENGSSQNSITLECIKEGLPTDERNIAYRAAVSFLEAFDKTGFNVNIRIEKKIPMAAGLAGGSADCAGVLLALENLFSLQSEHEKVLRLGAKLGADVPFCMTCGCAHATGIGDVMKKLPPITPEWAFVVAKAGEGVSTAEAYGKIDGRTHRRSSDNIIKHIQNGDIYAMCTEFYNAFEEVVAPVREKVSLAKEIMIEKGALGALMSGSGPSVFGIFGDIDCAEAAQIELYKQGYEAFVCFSVM